MNLLNIMRVTATDSYFCNGIGVPGRIVNIIYLIFSAIYIGVPLLLIIFGMIDLGKAVTQSDEKKIKEAQTLFIKRIIIAAIVFFVVAIVKLVIGIASTDSDSIINCINCFTSASTGKDKCHKCDSGTYKCNAN